ncbi:MAG: hypothetical protein R3B89_14735 [Polyangiaceae bacterium]
MAQLLAACAPAPASTPRPPVAVFAPEAPPPDSPPADSTPPLSPAVVAEPCIDPTPPAPECASDLLRVPSALAYNPRYALPPADVRRVLDDVATAMRAHPSWQMLRVEVYSSRDPGADPRRVRREMQQSQARADAIFGYLFHKRKISAERMDAIGYGYDVGFARRDVRWPVVLRLVHRLDSKR